MASRRYFTKLDHILIELCSGINAVFGSPSGNRPNPAESLAEPNLNNHELKQSIGYMRVNHCGEVCAQALYDGQCSVATNPEIKAFLKQAAKEETDHLNWCHQRLIELNGRRSLLNPIWYGGAYVTGVAAGLLGDEWSLGFVEETEKQVETHLQGHLDKLPPQDLKSRAIVEQMQQDEIEHGKHAHQRGARELPSAIKKLMRLQAKAMTNIAYWI